jgi:hypothetical protein
MTARERFAALDGSKRKLVLFMLAVLLLVGFLMMPSVSSLTGSLPGLAGFSGATKTQPRKPSAFAPSVAAPEPSKETTGSLPIAGVSLGNWVGQGIIAPRGLCTMKLELRQEQGWQDRYVGYSSLTCFNLQAMIPKKGSSYQDAMAVAASRLNPVSAVISGEMEKGAIRFNVDKTIGAGACVMTALTLTPFGKDEIGVEWLDGSCRGGQMMLKKIAP